MATAQPYSASILAYGDSFLYNEGVLCYLYGGYIRVLNVHDVGQTEQVLNIGAILHNAKSEFAPGLSGKVQLSLLHYSNFILACLCEIEDQAGSWLLAVDVRSAISQKGTAIRLFRWLRSNRNLFVRHNGKFLYWGTHSVHAPHGHHEWALHGVDLRNKKHTTDLPIHLEDFVGSEIGQAVCFEIHGDYLYAVSNQTSFVAEEIDWTSYYCCLRLSLATGRKTPLRRIWRRQHREGPINDTWTDLSLRADGETGGLVIMECRREWQNGGSENFRTYYSQPLDCFSFVAEKEPSDRTPPLSGFPTVPISLPQNEPLTSTLGPHNKPNYEPEKKRLRRYFHSEYSPDDECSQRRDFILAKTKYRAYHPSASTFLDIVNDPPVQSTFAVPRDRLRLRIGSRKRKSPIDENGEEGDKGLLFPIEHDKKEYNKKTLEISDERFTSRGIRLWPPDDAPPELLELLCPGRAGRIEASSDDRTLVYSTEACSTPYGQQRPIILVNFDPTIRFQGLKRLSSQMSSATETKLPIDIERMKPGECLDRPRSVTLSAQTPEHHQATPRRMLFAPQPHHGNQTGEKRWEQKVSSHFKQERAMYYQINQGYWLR